MEYTSPLRFDLELSSPRPIDRFKLDKIHNWLGGGKQYKQLIIQQEDLRPVYYNCIITVKSDVYYNNSAYSIRCGVLCDSPWAWEKPFNKEYSFLSGDTNPFTIYNTSSNDTLTYPVVQFTLAPGQTGLSLINRTLNNLEFAFSGLSPGETIKVDNRRQIIQSSLAQYRSSNFNKVFFALTHGKNELELRGRVTSLIVQFPIAKRKGG